MNNNHPFLYCLVCMREYKNKQCYNQHLFRQPHQKKFAKLQLLNDRYLIRDQEKWEKWKDANEPKENDKKST